MLLILANWIDEYIRAVGVLNYITLRAVLATLTALGIGLFLGPAVIRKLTAMKVGQAVRDDGPQTHLIKTGTPTMGGALILLSIGLTTLLWADLSNRFVWAVMIVTIGFGAVGWVDDYRKVVHQDPRGLPGRWKYFWQSVIGILAAIYLAFSVPAQSNAQALDLFIQWVSNGFSISCDTYTAIPTRAIATPTAIRLYVNKYTDTARATVTIRNIYFSIIHLDDNKSLVAYCETVGTAWDYTPEHDRHPA
jgi:phospho-N-acetylmuramoyl-pentapeptide-transferase